ncbi:ATP-binding protein [Allostreptomyces psammosilenae]|uniref:Uncharacterized protein n=1 Tax=Allostreptomyces psammosilenae TaxID=1892865 RepID=A0A853A471_9ACTN|nr:hypothetical protein [Allostreptomyces psammosilenae]
MSIARRRLCGELDERQVPEPVVDDAALIISELLSNAFRHGRPLDPRLVDDAEDLRPPTTTPRTPVAVTVPLGSAPLGPAGPVGQLGQVGAVPVGSLPLARHTQETAEAPATANGTGTATAPAPDGGGVIRAHWRITVDGLLRLEVTDGGGPTRPRAAMPSLTAHGGRGLGIVATLALDWGFEDGAQGEVTVWAVLPVRARHARRPGLPVQRKADPQSEAEDPAPRTPARERELGRPGHGRLGPTPRGHGAGAGPGAAAAHPSGPGSGHGRGPAGGRGTGPSEDVLGPEEEAALLERFADEFPDPP